MPQAKIIDLSHNNDDVQFGVLKKGGLLAAFFKASQGASYRDPTLVDRLKRARSVGLLVGVYHFIDGTPQGPQCDNFKAAIKGLGPVLPVLDFESNPAGPDATAPICEDMIDTLLADWNRHPGIYGSNYLSMLSQGSHNGNALRCWLWEARYGTHAPIAPVPFGNWYLWQYSENGPLQMGGEVRTDIDLSTYNPAVFPSDTAFSEWWNAHTVTVS